MMIPMIHLNGTSRDELLRQVREANEALRTALDKLEQASPHSRDYYVHNNANAFKIAQAEFRRRYDLVQDVLREMEALGEAIVDAPGRP